MVFKFLEKKVPPVAVFLICGALVFALSETGVLTFKSTIVTEVLAIMLVLLGVTLGLAGVMQFKQSSTTVNPVDTSKSSSLVTAGIYRITRNPMYVGMLFILIAMGIWFASVLSIAVMIFFIAYLTRFQIVPEERALEDIFGQPYKDYKQRVRRWL